jgi:hypothetical protein
MVTNQALLHIGLIDATAANSPITTTATAISQDSTTTAVSFMWHNNSYNGNKESPTANSIANTPFATGTLTNTVEVTTHNSHLPYSITTSIISVFYTTLYRSHHLWYHNTCRHPVSQQPFIKASLQPPQYLV